MTSRAPFNTVSLVHIVPFGAPSTLVSVNVSGSKLCIRYTEVNSCIQVQHQSIYDSYTDGAVRVDAGCIQPAMTRMLAFKVTQVRSAGLC